MKQLSSWWSAQWCFKECQLRVHLTAPLSVVLQAGGAAAESDDSPAEPRSAFQQEVQSEDALAIAGRASVDAPLMGSPACSEVNEAQLQWCFADPLLFNILGVRRVAINSCCLPAQQ